MLFRRNDKGKTSFAFMLRTQAKAFDEGMFSTSSRQALLIEPAVCLKNILLLSISWDKPETRRCWANLVKCITSPQNIPRFTETEFANCRILHFNFLQSFNHSRWVWCARFFKRLGKYLNSCIGTKTMNRRIWSKLSLLLFCNDSSTCYFCLL